MRQSRPSCLPFAILALLAAIAVGYVILAVVLRAGPGERPADLTPTAVPVIVLEPTPRVFPTPIPTATTTTPVPEPILAATRVVPTATETPMPTSTARPKPTRKPPEEMRQRG